MSKSSLFKYVADSQVDSGNVPALLSEQVLQTCNSAKLKPDFLCNSLKR